MIEQIAKTIAKDKKYWIFSLFLLLLVLAISTINYSSDTGLYTLNLPNTKYGIIIYSIILIIGIYGIVISRNADKEGVKLERLFLHIVIPIGIIMCFATPLGRVPDEDHHAMKSMAISQGNLFSNADENGNAKDMLNAKLLELVSRFTESYEMAWEKITIPETEAEVEAQYNTMALYSPVSHAPQALGMFVARFLDGGITVQCYMARFFNFALAIFLIYNAIKLIPYKKHLMLFLGLLPVTTNQIISMSADVITISISFFFISYILYLKYDENKKMYNKKDIAILAITTIVIALCKIVYLPLCLLILILPKEKFGLLKNKKIIVISILSIAITLNLIWLVYCSRFLIEFNGGVNSKEQVLYILRHPITYCITCFRTLIFFTHYFIMGICGDCLGSYCVQTSPCFIFSCVVIISILFFNKDEKTKVKFDNFTKIVFLLIFLATVLLIFTSLYVQWTPAKNSIILGIQPRYFLPILFLLAVVFDNSRITIKGNYNRFLMSFLLFFNLNLIAATTYTYYFGNLIYYIK